MIEFPFQRDTHYSLGELRKFRTELVRTRKTNQDFSSDLRSNDSEISWAKLWNEELAPLAILADVLNCNDEDEFKISVRAMSGPDAYLVFDNLELPVQITVSDPEWESGGNGGYTNYLENEVLRGGGVAWGGGGTKKDSGKIVSCPRTLNSHESIAACRRGIWNSLERKVGKSKGANLLLVYARGYQIQTIDDGLEFVVEVVIESFLLQKAQFDFDKIVFVTNDDGPSFEWNRRDKQASTIGSSPTVER